MAELADAPSLRVGGSNPVWVQFPLPAPIERCTMKENTICAVLVNDYGQILPYTCQPTMSQCEEFCSKFFPAWDRMKELGCKIVQAEIRLLTQDK
jgi:hypothetical protein